MSIIQFELVWSVSDPISDVPRISNKLSKDHTLNDMGFSHLGGYLSGVSQNSIWGSTLGSRPPFSGNYYRNVHNLIEGIHINLVDREVLAGGAGCRV